MVSSALFEIKSYRIMATSSSLGRITAPVSFQWGRQSDAATWCVISRHAEERLLAGTNILAQLMMANPHLRAALVISSSVDVAVNAFSRVVSPGFNLHVIPPHDAVTSMPNVMDFVTHFSRLDAQNSGSCWASARPDNRSNGGKSVSDTPHTQSPMSPSRLAIFFDCTHKDLNRLQKHTVFFRDLLFHAKLLRVSVVLLCGTCPDLDVDTRSQLNYVIAFPEPFVDHRKQLFSNFFNLFERYSEFSDIFERYVTNGLQALMVDNTIRSNSKWNLICSTTMISDDKIAGFVERIPLRSKVETGPFCIRTVSQRKVYNDDIVQDAEGLTQTADDAITVADEKVAASVDTKGDDGGAEGQEDGSAFNVGLQSLLNDVGRSITQQVMFYVNSEVPVEYVSGNSESSVGIENVFGKAKNVVRRGERRRRREHNKRFRGPTTTDENM